MAGCQARSFAPWVRAVASSLAAAEAPGAAAPAATLQVPVLNAELQGVGLAKAAQQGLPAEWVTKLTLLDPHRRQVCPSPPPLPSHTPFTHTPTLTPTPFFALGSAVQLQASSYTAPGHYFCLALTAWSP